MLFVFLLPSTPFVFTFPFFNFRTLSFICSISLPSLSLLYFLASSNISFLSFNLLYLAYLQSLHYTSTEQIVLHFQVINSTSFSMDILFSFQLIPHLDDPQSFTTLELCSPLFSFLDSFSVLLYSRLFFTPSYFYL